MISQEVIPAIAILTGLGFLFATILALAYKKLRVEEDPRIDQVEELLPGANCGACGSPGCRAFAELVVAGSSNPGRCTVSSAEGVSSIASFLGVEVSQEEKRVARVLCAGGKNEAHNRADYEGHLKTCRGEAVVAGGPKDCSWGCLGLGDCATVCDFDAIVMSDDALPVVDPEKCTACGDCVEICPKGLFSLMPISQKLLVQCKSQLEGDLATEQCTVACTACSRCVADASPDLISIRKGLAVIDYDLNHVATKDAIRRCPTGAIVWLERDGQFEAVEEEPLPLGRVERTKYDIETYYQ